MPSLQQLIYRPKSGKSTAASANELESSGSDDFAGLNLRGGDGSQAYGDGDNDDSEGGMANGLESDDEDEDGFRTPLANGISSGVSAEEFQPGAIVRVTLENFVTYEQAEFHPGGKLNMVIGPNGTGKSSLVCAICLGLGYHPNVLGRATTFAEFVKHGQDHAITEIELKKGPGDEHNHVIKLRINQEDNGRKFWINDRESTHKAVQKLVRSLRIQIDNLCQFLPQDKVAEFAGLSPVDLLTKTLQATAPPEMIESQNKLKEFYSTQKEVQQRVESEAEELKKKESRQQTLQADVEKLRERAEIQKVLDDLEKALVFAKYDHARGVYKDAKKKLKNGERDLKRLQESFTPSLQAVNAKEDYLKRVQDVVKYRETVLKDAESASDGAIPAIEAANEAIKKVEAEAAAEEASKEKLKQALRTAKQTINNLEGKLNHPSKNFDAAEWNRKIREQEHKKRELVNEQGEILDEIGRMKQTGGKKVFEKREIHKKLDALNSQQGKLESWLSKNRIDVFKAWQWVKANQKEFEKEVFGPPIMTCSLNDDRYADLVQACLSENDFFSFTAQSKADYLKLSDQVYKKMGLAVTLRSSLYPLSHFTRPVSKDRIQALGLDGFAIDYMEGPEPVLATLCANKSLHTSLVGLKELDDEQFEALASITPLTQLVDGKKSYKIMRRPEYGSDAVSTTIRGLWTGRFWKDQPVDHDEINNLKATILALQDEIDQMTADMQEKKDKREALESEIKEIEQTEKELRTTKNELQKEYSRWQALPDKIANEKKNLERLEKQLAETKQRWQEIVNRKDEAIEKAALAVLRHQRTIKAIRDAARQLSDAQVIEAEAQSEVRALRAENDEINKRLEQEKESIQELKNNMSNLKREAEAAIAAVHDLVFEDGQDQTGPQGQRCKTLADENNIEALQDEIDTQRARMDVIHASNPGALEEYERRAAEIDKMRQMKERLVAQFEELTNEINEIKSRWEPRVDELVRKINDAFSHNFEQINCGGEVNIHKDEDFEKWAIEIKVKFRPNEALQLLDQHRQSGGERAVSTIFYLMALQAMAQAPFRVVDEINQGMDPRNERMVHERMVEIACREHTSQYFLITPKLLPGLRYDDGMRVLCIASGPEMPVDGSKKMDTSRFADLHRRYLSHLRSRAGRA